MNISAGIWTPEGHYITGIGTYTPVSLRAMDNTGKAVFTYSQGMHTPNDNFLPLDPKQSLEDNRQKVHAHYEKLIQACIATDDPAIEAEIIDQE